MIDYKPFIDDISHPNKKKLAIDLISKQDKEQLYSKYSRLRVDEMQKQITRYNKDPENYFDLKGTCENCGL